VGPTCRRGEERMAGYHFRLISWAVGRLRDWAEWLPPGSFSYFYFFSSFSFSVSFISFVSFANMYQINSNHFHKFCIIHSRVSNQHQTCFQNQSKVFNKRSWLSLMALLV
jgi:hypothetical protein